MCRIEKKIVWAADIKYIHAIGDYFTFILHIQDNESVDQLCLRKKKH